MSFRLLITLASAAAGLVLAGATSRWLDGNGVADTIDYFEPDAEALRAFQDVGERTISLGDGAEPPLRRFALPAYLAERIFPIEGSNRYDPTAYYAYRPNLDQRIRFREHPEKRWRLRTNSLGMRRDTEVLAEKPDLRVLVAGDSHVDGVCNNDEAFPALVEAQLERTFPGRTVELLNASHGGYEPYNYLGVLEKYLYLDPDVFVIVITGANDFSGVLHLAHLFDGTDLVGLPPSEHERKAEAIETSRPALASGCHALHFFKHRPDQLEYSLASTRAILAEVRRICEHEGIRPLLCYLPMQAALPWSETPEHLRRVIDLLELSPADLSLAFELRERLLDACDELGLPALDLGTVLTPDEHFYRSDLHLNTFGHAAVAELLLEQLVTAPELQP